MIRTLPYLDVERREGLTYVDLVENGNEKKRRDLGLVENDIEMLRWLDSLVENVNEMVICWHALGKDVGNLSEMGTCVDL